MVSSMVDGEHDAMQAQRVGRRVLRLGAGRRRDVVLGQLQLAVAVRGPHHGDVAPDPVESDGAVRSRAFDLRLAVQLHAELGEERDSRIQVFDDDGDVVHPLNSHVSDYRERGETPVRCAGTGHPAVRLENRTELPRYSGAMTGQRPGLE